MKILTLWLGAFWFAINKLIWENNPDEIFYACELNKDIFNSLLKTRLHPYFFEWYKLPNNIELIDNIDDIISEVDLLIVAVPVQFIFWALSWLSKKLKKWVTILNLAKWIDIKQDKTISQLLEKQFIGLEYNYSVLSWWMIASEVVEWKKLWADLWIQNIDFWNKIKQLFENENLKIEIRKDILNIELYWSIKNIMAILVWYYEWKWEQFSTIWYYLVEFYSEMKDIISIYWWNKELDFSYYSLWWDIVATCFWNSRNRYFGNLLWKWNSINEVLEILKSEKKHAEWYETLKAVYNRVKDEDWFEITKLLYSLIK